MNFGLFGPREAIFGICGLAAAYIAVALFQLYALQRRRKRAAKLSVKTVVAPSATAPVPSEPAVSEKPRGEESGKARPADPAPPERREQAPDPAGTRVQLPAEIKHSVVRIYVKSASVEVPNMPRLPKYAVQPKIDVGLVVNAHPVWAEHLECSLGISLHAKLNDMTMFLMEIVQCGLFRMHEADPKRLNEFVRETAQSVLFPYARKYLAALAVDAGFQPLVLDPIDFGDLLAKATQRFQIAPAARPAP